MREELTLVRFCLMTCDSHMTKDILSTKRVTPNRFGGISSKLVCRKTLSIKESVLAQFKS